MLRYMPLALLVLSGVHSLAASPPTSPPTGAAVQTWWVDTAQRELVVRLVNTSSKAITAFDLAVVERFTDGTEQLNYNSTDFLPLMASAQISQGVRDQYRDGTFPAGTGRDIRIPLVKQLRDASVTVDVVIYADRTEENNNKEILGQLLAARRGTVLAMQQANEIITKALDSPNPRDTANKGLQGLADAAAQNHSRSDDPSNHTETELRRLVAEVGHEDLPAVVKQNEARIAFYSAQGVQP
jgi:hypothetical protein